MARRSALRRRQNKKRGWSILLVVLLATIGVGVWKLTGEDGNFQKFREIFLSKSRNFVQGDQVRGILYDRQYKKLAESLERVSVYVRTRELDSIEDAVEGLAPLIRVGERELLRKLRSDDLRVWLAKNIDQQQEEAIRELDLAGVYLHKEHSRYYPQNLVAAHLIGYVQDDIGLAGAEFYYDRLEQRMLSDREGGQFRVGAGQHVVLTLDLKVQNILEDLVEQVQAGRQEVKIGAYAMDAKNGAVIGAVQSPSFNPNTYRIYSQDVLKNLLVEPMLLPPLFRRLFKHSAEIQTQNELRGKVHPWSLSNTETSLGSELRLWEGLGFTDSAPQDFGNSDSRYSGRTDVFIVPGQLENSFGTVPEQVSPLNLMKAVSSLLNGGTRVEPYLAQAVVDPVTGQEYQLRPEAVVGEEAIVVHHSVSREISSLVSKLGRRGELGGVILNDAIHLSTSSREGFGYLSNELIFAATPVTGAQLVVMVTIQGGSRNIPVKPDLKQADPVKLIADIMARLAVRQQIGKSIAEVAEPEDGKNVNYPMELEELKRAVKESYGTGNKEVVKPGRMPALVGLSIRKSLRLLQEAPCEIRIFGTGRVVAQKPAAGDPLTGVQECIIRLQRQADVSLEALEEKLTK